MVVERVRRRVQRRAVVRIVGVGWSGGVVDWELWDGVGLEAW